MKEIDYINATNLAKLRAAWTILRDVLPTTQEEKDFDSLVRGIRLYVERYERIVKTDT